MATSRRTEDARRGPHPPLPPAPLPMVNDDRDPRSVSFPTTIWCQVSAAGDRDTPEGRAALETLCEAYWYPIYALIRKRGHPHHDAIDLTQAYFLRLLERGTLRKADPGRGRFRAFLRTDCTNFLIDHHRAESIREAVRRPLPIDGDLAASRYAREKAQDLSPERLYERTWAVAILERTLERVREEYDKGGRGALYASMRAFLLEGRGAGDTAAAAARLGMTENALHIAVHRLKKRFNAALADQIRATLADPSELDDEIRWVFRAVAWVF